MPKQTSGPSSKSGRPTDLSILKVETDNTDQLQHGLSCARCMTPTISIALYQHNVRRFALGEGSASSSRQPHRRVVKHAQHTVLLNIQPGQSVRTRHRLRPSHHHPPFCPNPVDDSCMIKPRSALARSPLPKKVKALCTAPCGVFHFAFCFKSCKAEALPTPTLNPARLNMARLFLLFPLLCANQCGVFLARGPALFRNNERET